jgi:hypothetical protein
MLIPVMKQNQLVYVQKIFLIKRGLQEAHSNVKEKDLLHLEKHLQSRKHEKI